MKDAVTTRRSLLAAGCAAFALAGCGGIWSSHATMRPGSPPFADDALADYLPHDAGAVYTVHVRQALESPVGKQLAGLMRQFLDKETADHPWLDDLGVSPVNAVEQAQFIFCAPDLNRPLILLRGRFDADRFAVGSGKLRGTSDGPFSFYELPGRSTSLAVVGDCLAVCDSRPRLLAALNYAAAPKSVELQDAPLRGMLETVDRKQSAWLAVSLGKLGPVPRFADLGLETVMRPVLRHAESVYGGVTVGEDVRGEFIFRAHTDADAKELEQDLTASCTVAQGAYLLPGVDPSLLPLLRFIGTGETTRDGRAVVVHCRLQADRVGP